MNIYTFCIVLLFNLLVFYICKKKQILIDTREFFHKSYVEQKNKNYLLGGFFFLTFFLFSYSQHNYQILFLICLIFLLGLGSDIKILENVKLRFFFQIIIILLIVQVSKIQIFETRVIWFNELLKLNFISLIFTVFCLMIFVNGINFIDGINTFALFYFFFITLVVLLLKNYYFIPIDYNFYLYFFCALLIMLVINYFGIVFLGDSGSYLIGLVIGLELIKLSSSNYFISPYFIILLVLYPCFEILFSIIRRVLRNTKSYHPDNSHMHQLLYKFFKKNFIFNLLNLHLITSLSINLTLMVFFTIGMIFLNDSKMLVILILIKIFFYFTIYQYLKKP